MEMKLSFMDLIMHPFSTTLDILSHQVLLTLGIFLLSFIVYNLEIDPPKLNWPQGQVVIVLLETAVNFPG